MSHFRYFLRLRFRGTGYHGWQSQENALSVQQTINEALTKVLREEVQTTGCGRTDTGVHAENFYAHFDLSQKIKNPSSVLGKLSSLRISGIDFLEFIPVNPDANARFDALSRTYEYRIIRTRNPFLIDYSHFIYGPIDEDKMKNATKFLIGKQDFGAFSKSNTQVKTNICDISDAHWFQRAEQLIFSITADRFLRNMVRAITGTLIEIGQGKRPVHDMSRVIKSLERSEAGMSVPARGLFLMDIKYPENIFSEMKMD